jgi:predicted dehydrogenase
MKKTYFAVIGLGHIGRRHTEMILRHKEAELVAICDIDNSVYRNDIFGAALFYTDIQEMLVVHPNIEIVNICTPNGLHAEHTLAVLAAGKHAVVEKPLTTNKLDAEKIITGFLRNAKPLFAAFTMDKKRDRTRNFGRYLYGTNELFLES